MRRKYGARGLIPLVSIIALSLMVGCAGLKFHFQLENKLAIAKEGGYQIMLRLLKEIPEGEAKERIKANAEAEFTVLRADLGDADLVIDASYLKSKLYVWIRKALEEIKTPLSEEDIRLILKTQDFFALEGGYEATPEQRVIGIAFCDGVLEALEKS